MRRRLTFLLLVLLLVPGQVAAITSLEARIQSATGIVRPVDATLQARAAIRAVQIQTDFSHCCLGPNQAEIIAWNSGYADPLVQLVVAWLGSPEHRAILVNPSWHTIGCATSVKGDRTYGVCILSAATGAPPPDGGIDTLPDAAMRAP